MTAFATAADMIARYDARTLGDLVTDDGNQVAENALAANPKMTAALATATGQIKAAVLRAERYTTAELEALTGESQQYLKDLTCQIAFWCLWRRRPYIDDQQRNEVKASADEALELLRTGAHVFDIDRQKDAGTPKVETITRAEVENDWSLFVDQARGNFYPRRRTYKQR
jgi:phage gp36-like protein